MPELPEVETFLRQLRPQLLNKKITDFTVSELGLRLLNKDYQAFKENLLGRNIVELKRIGKFLIVDLGYKSIITHPRMSGRYSITTDKPDSSKHNRLHLELNGKTYLNMHDIRRFGTFHITKSLNEYPSFSKIGPDALSKSFTVSYLKNILIKSNRAIYALLMDQSVVAGLGNIYTNEVLFASRIHPKRIGKDLSEDEIMAIVSNTRQILRAAINFKGTTLIDKSYSDLGGNYGEYFNKLAVYGKHDQSCRICNQTINKIKLNSRSVYLCPGCQQYS